MESFKEGYMDEQTLPMILKVPWHAITRHYIPSIFRLNDYSLQCKESQLSLFKTKQRAEMYTVSNLAKAHG